MPGYYHSVPPGQKPFQRPVHEIDATPRIAFEDEDEKFFTLVFKISLRSAELHRAKVC